MSKQKQKTICVHNMFSACSELGIFMYWTCNSMNNLSWYFGLVDEKIGASDKDLPVPISEFNQIQKQQKKKSTTNAIMLVCKL